jgi:hypothetical protein
VRLGDAHVIPEGILDPEVARAPRTPLQLLDDAPRAPRDPVCGLHVVDRHDDLDAVAPLRRPAKAPKVGVPPDRGRTAPEAQQRVAALEHEVAVVAVRRLVPGHTEAEAAVKARRQREVRHVKLDQRSATPPSPRHVVLRLTVITRCGARRGAPR